MMDQTTKLEKEIVRKTPPKAVVVLRLFFDVFRKNYKMCLLFFVLCLLLSALRPLMAYLWGYYIDIIGNENRNIWRSLFILLGYYLTSVLVNLIWRYTEQKEPIERLDIVQMNRFKEGFLAKFFLKLGMIRAEAYEVPAINNYINQVYGFISDSWDGVNCGIMLQGYYTISKILSIVLISVTLFAFNRWLVLLPFIALIPVLYATYFEKRLGDRFKVDNTEHLRKIQYYQDIMRGITAKEVRVNNAYAMIVKKIDGELLRYTNNEHIAIRNSAFLRALGEFITNGVNAAGIVIVVLFLLQSKLTVVQALISLELMTTLVGDFSTLFTALAQLAGKRFEAARYFDIMKLSDESDKAKDISRIQTIVFDDVSYRYPTTDNYVLKHINLTISAGERIALVGENGAGKTTFTKLLMGLLIPTEGHILVNGEPLTEDNCLSYRKAITGVFQDAGRYKTFTIGENVKLGNPDCESDEAQIGDLLRFVGLGELEEGTLLGKEVGGIDLSGGQWQKIAIARSLYKSNIELVILDEPSSNLDPISESNIFQQYLEMTRGMTSLYVTHRISFAALAERIIVFCGGEVVEDGNQQSLLRNNKIYAALYNAQAGSYIN